MRATLLQVKASGQHGDQYVYRLDPPFAGQEHVMASVIRGPHAHASTVPYAAFPCDPQGRIHHWTVLHAAAKADSPREVIESMGYRVVSETAPDS